ncbi:unnamed protein product [Bursaphelenchus okinawaensis]|uniref:GDNF/GAS1 domain-containing protein n=1 Tax=Bursaphelenchus okinawaensis TaxID=465554 RepID=A0A811L0N4_9BILA|nr:unnamed protein product [Bursaphelenchus okinawaensis]CAG9114041.1 unnamed protein product [Bursaphelenchus okinawaensis]
MHNDFLKHCLHIPLVLLLLCNITYAFFLSCTHLKTRCMNSIACRTRHNALNNNCFDCANASSNLANLLALRQQFGHDTTCHCHGIHSTYDCIAFKEEIWQNPCEERWKQCLKRSHKDANKRTTRSPNSDKIQQWRNELSYQLPSQLTALSQVSCNQALHEVCLKHISCRELWKLFRETCTVDEQNVCRMTNRNDCWQSFEGISWTGLGNCSCTTNNSDCHWIRLQTNYNKCIYEIATSGDIPKTVSVQIPIVSTTKITPYWVAATTPQPYYHVNHYTTISVDTYQREVARREQERLQHAERLRRYEEQRRRWEEQNRRNSATTAATFLATTPNYYNHNNNRNAQYRVVAKHYTQSNADYYQQHGMTTPATLPSNGVVYTTGVYDRQSGSRNGYNDGKNGYSDSRYSHTDSRNTHKDTWTVRATTTVRPYVVYTTSSTSTTTEATTTSTIVTITTTEKTTSTSTTTAEPTTTSTTTEEPITTDEPPSTVPSKPAGRAPPPLHKLLSKIVEKPTDPPLEENETLTEDETGAYREEGIMLNRWRQSSVMEGFTGMETAFDL